MKAIKTQSIFGIILRAQIIILLFFVVEIKTFSQNTKSKTRVRMSLDFYNNVDHSRSLDATLYYIENRVRKPVINELIVFYLGEISDNILIDSLLTDNNGVAQLSFGENLTFDVDEERSVQITADFKGNKTVTSAKSSISITDVFMELFISEIELTKMVSVRAYEMGNNKEMFPVEEAKVNFYVPRLFGDQLVGDGNINDGKCSIEFPENIAGDTIGNISIIARIEDHDDYGNVERQLQDFRWGATQPIEEDKSLMTIEISIPTRALWHTNAPLWMIVTLIILLTGVWSHYFYVVFQLIKLNRLNKNKKINNPEEI